MIPLITNLLYIKIVVVIVENVYMFITLKYEYKITSAKEVYLGLFKCV